MEVLHERCAGIDLSKRDAKVCIRAPGARAGTYSKKISAHGAMHRDITGLRDLLIAEQVTLAVMEATGDYWKPFYYGLEDEVNVILVNARDAKNLPGRKTDVSDAQWLAELGAHGLVRASFVPPWPIRQLRDLTRHRTMIARQRTREIQRIEKLVESTGIKYTSVASDTLGASGRAFLEAMIGGQTDPTTLSGLAKGLLRRKTEQLQHAFEGNFTTHHGMQLRLYLDRIDLLDTHTRVLTEQIGGLLTEHDLLWARELLDTIPGIGPDGAENILAEIGADMTVFPTPAQLVSWAGVCPGQHESAGKSRAVRTRPGNKHLKGALGTAAMAAIRAKDGGFFRDRHHRITARRGPGRALVATQRAILIAIWHILSRAEPYRPHTT